MMSTSVTDSRKSYSNQVTPAGSSPASVTKHLKLKIMESLLVNLSLLAIHVLLATKSYKNEKHEACIVHSFGAGVHFGLLILATLIEY